MAQPAHSRPSALRRFLDGQSSAGLVLMAAAALALVVANSPLAPAYVATLSAYVGPLSVGHWINDGLMAVFFLLVGLEIKREALDGQLSTWSRRALPGFAALGGMVMPALIFLAFNRSAPAAGGWAIPAATDIAFALGVLSLLGSRVPASLRVFLAALAIIDDLGAVVIIALFYTAQISLPDLAGAAAVVAALVAMNRLGVRRLAPYLLLGLLLWLLVLRSGVHATLAGVILAFTIPLATSPGRPDDTSSPLHRLEHALHLPVGFLVVPIFGLANAGVPFLGLPAEAFAAPVTLGVGLGLLVGKLAGVLGASLLAIRLGLADFPAYAGRLQLAGTALLCGIGFTMSLFITLLAFPADPLLQTEAKIGILGGSLVAGLLGYLVLRVAPQDWPGTPSR
ncbi:Na(+)/H(+) antiporter NhaA [Pseudoroseomonas deserti]|uniref:Na(+)/H(+) antiporter NhaA n=1 Tax=Teichococcus deserti TaxID=1817963 RepID=A0A1V2H2L0_9PROT|nr:Na+/H+ antiporter NhaA [Pseudoroseomonas deserti]ONG53969.1 Na(+)/H(+) antiporter NhaA [Pseudoroseomonas deserti]